MINSLSLRLPVKFPFNSYDVILKQRFVRLCKKNLRTYSFLGIETSCDDTGAAIINSNGELLSNRLHSQNLIHLRNGGIIPDVAQDLHRQYIEPTINQTFKDAKLTMENIEAVAVTLEPGLALSLSIGMKYAKHIARKYNKPIIPIHHMEAHALVVRMQHEVSFPYLTLLISGGHCLLAVAKDVNKFLLLGESKDNAPGEVFDKVARRLKLRNLSEYSQMCGGQAIETAATKATNPYLFQLPVPLTDYRDCNFSFAGMKTSALYQLFRKEREYGVKADELIPEVNDLCAALLLAVSRHLVHRTERAMQFCLLNDLIPKENKQLVVSGGVACNDFIFNALSMLCKEFDFKIFRPSPELCTDNGVMIAWNGLEKWRRGIDVVNDFSRLDIQAVSPLGESLISEVAQARIPVKLVKLRIKT